MSEKRYLFEEYYKQGHKIGVVMSSRDQLVSVSGLESVSLNELIVFETGSTGFVFGMRKGNIEIVLLSKGSMTPGTKAVNTGQAVSFPCSHALLGKSVSPLGKDLVEHRHLEGRERTVEAKAAGIASRVKITTPFTTGTMLVDTLLPLGKGQRELLLGDRKTGKTQFALDTLVHQAKLGTICIYVAIGKSQPVIKHLAAQLRANNIQERTVLLATTADDPSGLVYLAPMSGMTLAEYFRDQGNDVLLIMDDLTTHARVYRQLSLLARRFPGRNAYPGDIFYLHSRLLERAGNFCYKDKESVAITCLPIAETQQADLTGYVQTNLMSMTDGHLYFDLDRFLEGHRPAVHPFLSVTRVGRQTQTPLLRETIAAITSFLSRSERLNQISHFGQELSAQARDSLEKAEKYTFLFDLPETKTWEDWFQFFILALLWDGYWLHSWDDTLEGDIRKLHSLAHTHHDTATAIQALLATDSFTNAGTKARKLADTMFAQN